MPRFIGLTGAITNMLREAFLGLNPLKLAVATHTWDRGKNSSSAPVGGDLWTAQLYPRFPHENLKLDGYQRASPVIEFPPNDFGVYDMIGNMWERTADWYSAKHKSDVVRPRCIPENSRGAGEEVTYEGRLPTIKISHKVLKSGSQLCARSIIAVATARSRVIRSRRTCGQTMRGSAAFCVCRQRRND
jgi:formylglycine-generating enzyme required for sulfatase activity